MVECLYRDSARRSEWKFKAFKKLPNQGKQSSVLNQGTVSHEPGVSNQPAVEAATTAPHRSTPRGPNHRFRIPFFR